MMFRYNFVVESEFVIFFDTHTSSLKIRSEQKQGAQDVANCLVVDRAIDRRPLESGV
jgi:hypothetical protein